ncbi:Jerky [Chionoecetes opilio]|uniref:Jerky n=1 Tax=Chionoecetes opilio TaxID=41210 RepID=A0A8J4Y7S1_CHIOP|nr:Jerky [Chionoecetes opilio]
MEKILNRWISEQVDQRKSNVDGVAIREKARSIYDHLAEKEPSGSSPAPGFIASHGWFHRFKQRFSLHNIARTGESGSADKEGAQAYLSTFKSLIEDSGLPT